MKRIRNWLHRTVVAICCCVVLVAVLLSVEVLPLDPPFKWQASFNNTRASLLTGFGQLMIMVQHVKAPKDWAEFEYKLDLPGCFVSLSHVDKFSNNHGLPGTFTRLEHGHVTCVVEFSPLLLAVLTAIYPFFATVLFVRHRRKTRSPNACRKCFYDLTGNESGNCPECGQAISTDTAAQLTA